MTMTTMPVSRAAGSMFRCAAGGAALVAALVADVALPLSTSVLLALPGAALAAADACKFRGDLDERYCDENRDLIADMPTDPKKLKDPPFLLFT